MKLQKFKHSVSLALSVRHKAGAKKWRGGKAPQLRACSLCTKPNLLLTELENHIYLTYMYSNLITDDAVDASKPVVGSSRKRTSGDVINSIPIDVRFLSPPDIPLITSLPTLKNNT